jgi:hypothetical protein
MAAPRSIITRKGLGEESGRQYFTAFRGWGNGTLELLLGRFVVNRVA